MASSSLTASRLTAPQTLSSKLSSPERMLRRTTSSSPVLSRSKGCVPLSRMYRITPRLHTSALGPQGSPRSISGAEYATVPYARRTTGPPSTRAALPKSTRRMSLTSSRWSFRRMFSGLMSKCTTFCWCRKRTACSTSRKTLAASRSEYAPLEMSRSKSSPPLASSITRK